MSSLCMGLAITAETVSDLGPPPPPPLPVSLITVDGFPTLENVVLGASEITFTLSGTSVFAGTHVVDTSEQVQAASGPVNEVLPTITGSAGIGQVLSCDGGLWVFDPDNGIPEYSFQWRRSGVSIPGATAQDYTLNVADSGQAISCLVTASQAVGTRSAISAALLMGQAPGGMLERVGTDFYADNTVSTQASIPVDLSAYDDGDTLLIFTGPGEFVADGDLSVDGVAATKISTDPAGLFGSRHSAFRFDLTGPGSATSVITTVNGSTQNSRIFAVYAMRGYDITQVSAVARNSGSDPLETALEVTSPVNAVLSCAVGLTWAQSTWTVLTEDETEVLTGDSISTAQASDLPMGTVTPSVSFDTNGRAALISVLLEVT